MIKYYEIERSYDYKDICKDERITFAHRGCMSVRFNFEMTATVNNTDKESKPSRSTEKLLAA